jgi:CheY-like chemotaxis protein
MHALIIEDEPMIAVLLEDLLRDHGCISFDFATTQVEAIVSAHRHRPDLITSDVRLAQGSGIIAVQAICSGKRIPVVFITATPSEVHATISDAVVVQKPFTSADLAQGLAKAQRNIVRPA